MISVLLIPAIILVLLSIKALSARRKHKKKISIYGSIAIFIPVILLMFLAEYAVVWSFQNFDSGNGSARAVHGVIFILFSTIAALYSLIIAYFVLPKKRPYKIALTLLAASILLPVLSYDAYDYHWQYQQGWVGGVSKNEIINAAEGSIDPGVKHKLVEVTREHDTWNVSYDLLDNQGKQIARKMIFVDAQSGKVDHTNETKISLHLEKNGVPLKNTDVYIGALWDMKDNDPYNYQASPVDCYKVDDKGDTTVWVEKNGIRTLQIFDQNRNEYDFKVPGQLKSSYSLELSSYKLGVYNNLP